MAVSILFVTGCLYTESSGHHLSLLQAAQTLADQGHEVTVIGTSAKSTHRASHWPVEAIAFKRYGPFSTHFAPGIYGWLKQTKRRWDVASFQSAWIYPNAPAEKFCREVGIPFMITTHGVFNPRALAVSAWKKRLAQNTFLKTSFDHVACYQVSTQIERLTLRQIGIKTPICVIGNGINLPDLDHSPTPPATIPPYLSQRRTCLYIGRLDPIKGLDYLLTAWAQLNPPDDWQLVIGGSGAADYRAYLEKMSQELPCRNVQFLGFISDAEKQAWLQQARFSVLPSNSEAFAMFPMESFACKTPVLMTTACGFPEAAAAGAAIAVEPSVEGVRNGLARFLAMTDHDLREMGDSAFVFVRDNYNWPTICTQLNQVYEWMLNRNAMPDHLYLD
jgi:glycosyltransferase involved in cell wall biosynthesis